MLTYSNPKNSPPVITMRLTVTKNTHGSSAIIMRPSQQNLFLPGNFSYFLCFLAISEICSWTVCSLKIYLNTLAGHAVQALYLMMKKELIFLSLIPKMWAKVHRDVETVYYPLNFSAFRFITA